MQRVADQQDVAGWDAEFCDPGAPCIRLAVRVDVVEAGQADEAGRQAEMGDDLAQRFPAVGGQYRLGRTRAPDLGEHLPGEGMEAAFPAARIVGGDELDAQLLETINREIEAEAAVVCADREIEHGVVAGAVQQRQPAAAEKAVHDVDAKFDVIEQGAVPVPDHVPVGCALHAARNLPAGRSGRQHLSVPAALMR